MKVEVEAAEIAALEQRYSELSALLTAVVKQCKNGTVTVNSYVDGSVEVERDGDSIVLTYKTAPRGTENG